MPKLPPLSPNTGVSEEQYIIIIKNVLTLNNLLLIFFAREDVSSNLLVMY